MPGWTEIADRLIWTLPVALSEDLYLSEPKCQTHKLFTMRQFLSSSHAFYKKYKIL